MSLSRYDASNAMNCKPRPSEASEHGPKFTPLGGSCCKGRVGRVRRTGGVALCLRSGSITFVLQRRAPLVVLVFVRVLLLSEVLPGALSETIDCLVVPFQKVHNPLGQRYERQIIQKMIRGRNRAASAAAAEAVDTHRPRAATVSD